MHTRQYTIQGSGQSTVTSYVQARSNYEPSHNDHKKKTRVLATISSRMLFGDLEVVPDGDENGYRRRCCAAKTVTDAVLLRLPYEAILYAQAKLANTPEVSDAEEGTQNLSVSTKSVRKSPILSIDTLKGVQNSTTRANSIFQENFREATQRRDEANGRTRS